jgi:hypothetical protein
MFLNKLDHARRNFKNILWLSKKVVIYLFIYSLLWIFFIFIFIFLFILCIYFYVNIKTVELSSHFTSTNSFKARTFLLDSYALLLCLRLDLVTCSKSDFLRTGSRTKSDLMTPQRPHTGFEAAVCGQSAVVVVNNG